MQDQVLNQKKDKRHDTDEEHECHVYDVNNFAWGFPLANIHTAMMVDLLHGLHKGLIEHLTTWLSDLGKQIYHSGYSIQIREEDGTVQSRKLDYIEMLNAHFCQAPWGTGLKVFQDFSAHTQWTGKDSRDYLRQLIPVITPIFKQKAPGALLFTRALVEFTLCWLVWYQSACAGG